MCATASGPVPCRAQRPCLCRKRPPPASQACRWAGERRRRNRRTSLGPAEGLQPIASHPGAAAQWARSWPGSGRQRPVPAPSSGVPTSSGKPRRFAALTRPVRLAPASPAADRPGWSKRSWRPGSSRCRPPDCLGPAREWGSEDTDRAAPFPPTVRDGPVQRHDGLDARAARTRGLRAGKENLPAGSEVVDPRTDGFRLGGMGPCAARTRPTG